MNLRTATFLIAAYASITWATSRFDIKKAPQKALFCSSQWPVKQVRSTALRRPLARVFLAAGVRAALQADLLAVAGGGGEALGWNGLGGADVGFDSDFLGHGDSGLKLG